MARKLAHGTKLKMGDGESSETFTTVAQLYNVGMPSQTRAVVDLSDHDTEEGMDFAGSRLIDGGTVSIEGHFDPLIASQIAFLTAVRDGLTRNWQIFTYDEVWVCSFSGFVTSHGGGAPSDSGSGKITFTAEIKVTGVPEYAAPE